MIDSNNISIKEIIGSFKFWPRIFKLLWGVDHKALLLIFILTIVEGIIPPCLLITNKSLINSIQVGTTKTFQPIIAIICILFFLYVLQIVIGHIKAFREQTFSKKLAYSISYLIMEKASKLSLADFENDNTYDQMQRIMGDSGHRPYTTFTQILNIISNFITLISTSLIIILWKWWIVLLLILVPIFSTISFFKLSKLEFKIDWLRAPIRRKLWYYSILLTRDFSIKEIKLFNLNNYLLNKYKEINFDFYKTDKRLISRKVKTSFVIDILNQFILIYLMIYIITSALTKKILLGSMVTYLQSLSSTQKSFQGLLHELFSIYENNLYITLLFNFLELSETDFPLNEEEKNELTHVESIEFVNVSFKYPNTEDYALRNVSFKAGKNDIIAIVGKNGSGKSTVIKILSRLYT
ncbi:ABC transporter ATP-binding protein [Bacillus sp. APMAM]|nr:ABC transporter ATP-binding protein [Bacillus sp. APMAM]